MGIHLSSGGTKFVVGRVERIILGKLVRVCACCSLTVDSCRCDHDPEIFYSDCPYHLSTF